MRSLILAAALCAALIYPFSAAAFETYEFYEELDGASYSASLIHVPEDHALFHVLRGVLYGGRSAEDYAADSLRSLADGFAEFHAGEAGDESEGDGQPGWYLEERSEVLAEADGMAVVAFYRESYEGGAHPNHGTSYRLLDALYGGSLSLRDFIEPEAEGPILDWIDGELRSLFDIGPDESLESGGLFIDRAELSEDFRPTADGLVFQWDPYEIAPYAFGDIEVLVPYGVFDGALAPRGAEWVAALFPLEEDGSGEEEYEGEADEDD